MSFDFEERHNVTEAVIYCRVSSKAQMARGDGLKSQETRCESYPEFKGYTVKKVFKDDLTGRKAQRPGLLELLDFLKSDRCNQYVVIVDDLTRFARKVPVHFEMRRLIAEAGGILEVPSVELRNDADGELHEYILASVSQHQSRKNAEQTLNRMKARLMNGYWAFAKVKGYEYRKVKGNGKMLFRYEPVASIIQEALEGFACGRFDTQSEVVRFLESQSDFPKDSPNGGVRNQRVFDMLRQPLYAGYLQSEKWGISLREAKHEGLVSFDTFQRIQQRLKDGARAPARKDLSEDFPLRNHVLCGDCSKPLTACWSKSKTGKKHPYYMCYNKACVGNRKSIRRDKIEGEFEELLESMQPAKKLTNVINIMFKQAWDQRLSQMKEATSSLTKEIDNIEKAIAQLVNRIVETENLSVVGAYENKITNLEKEKLVMQEKLAEKGEPMRSFEESFELAMQFLSNPLRLWRSGIYLQKMVLRMAFKERLEYDRCLLYTSPSPRDKRQSRMPSSA